MANSDNTIFSVGPMGLITITPQTLKTFVPKAFAATAENEDIDFNDGLWVMNERPVDLSEPDEDVFEYTQTNEPELGEWIDRDWDNLTVNIAGVKCVVLAGTWDDEYGYVWNPKENVWMSYSF